MSISSVLIYNDYFVIILSTLLASDPFVNRSCAFHNNNKKSCSGLKTKCLFNLCEQQYKRWSDGRNTNVSYRKGGNSWGKWAETGSFSSRCCIVCDRRWRSITLCPDRSGGNNLIRRGARFPPVPSAPKHVAHWFLFRTDNSVLTQPKLRR